MLLTPENCALASHFLEGECCEPDYFFEGIEISTINHKTYLIVKGPNYKVSK